MLFPMCAQLFVVTISGECDQANFQAIGSTILGAGLWQRSVPRWTVAAAVRPGSGAAWIERLVRSDGLIFARPATQAGARQA
jgi:hypothetical protein